MPGGIAASSSPRPLPAFAALATLALVVASLAACSGQPNASPSAAPVNPGGADTADLFAVVTADELDVLLGIDVASQTVSRLAVLGANKKQPSVDGGMVSVPPQSAVLFDASRAEPLVWTSAAGAGTVVRAFDRATGELQPVDAPGAGTLPFLADGKLGWASLPRDGKPRLISADGTFEVKLPGEPRYVVPGPGAGRVTAVVDLGDPNGPHRDERIVIVDIAQKTLTELPTERMHFGGIWADDKRVLASVFARIEPTPDDPENGEPDKRVLTWSVDPGGSNHDVVAGLVAGPTLRTAAFYPAHVVGGDGVVGVETGVFDAPIVESLAFNSNEPKRSVDLLHAEFITAISVVKRTLVVLQSSHVVFVDLDSGKATIVDLGGGTQTQWLGR
jgi:hypothetical protein